MQLDEKSPREDPNGPIEEPKEEWMKLLLAPEVIVKSVHPYVLEKFRSSTEGEILKRKN